MLALLLLIPLDLLLFVPRWIFDIHPLRPWHVSFDLLAIVAVATLTAGSRFARPARIAGGIAYAWLLLFMSYHQAFQFFFLRTPALGEDWRLLLNLAHFLGTMSAVKWSFVTLGSIVGLYAIARLTTWILERLQRTLERAPAIARWAGAVVTIGASGIALARSGIHADEPIVQLQSRRMIENWRASRIEAAKRADLRAAPTDHSYEQFDKVKLTRRPSFYLLIMESYGEILSTWDMTGAYQSLMHRVEDRLGALGLHAVTQYSAAPVHGGLSWFSIATIHTGIVIDRPLAHQALENVGAHLPTLTEFFRGQGYKTYTVQPGSKDRTGLKKLDLYHHDVYVDATSLEYTGERKYGYGEMPDQWTLNFFRTHQFKDAPEPRYLFFMSVSTHFPWGEEVPPHFLDWRNVDGPTDDVDGRWGPFPEAAQIATPYRQSYFRSVAYDWRVLTEFLEQDTAKDLVVVVVGDHQPRLEWDAPDFSMNAPVHVIARDPALLAAFGEAGFQPGLYAPPRVQPPLTHQALFSLIVSRLAKVYGDRAVKWFPDGIGLAGLNR